MAGSLLRRADTITGEGVGHLIEPPGNEPQLKPPQGAACLSHLGYGVVTAPSLPAVNERGAIGVHTQVACTPSDRRLHRRQKGGQLGIQGRQRAGRLAASKGSKPTTKVSRKQLWRKRHSSGSLSGVLMKAALDYGRLGWSVIPIEPRGKRPLVRWQVYQHRHPDATEVAQTVASITRLHQRGEDSET